MLRKQYSLHIKVPLFWAWFESHKQNFRTFTCNVPIHALMCRTCVYYTKYVHVVYLFFVCLDYLLSGITQLAYLSISPGSFRLNPGDKLSLETSDSLTVTTENDHNMLVVKETEDGQPYEFKVHLFHERENSMTSEAQVRGILKLPTY